MTRNPFLPIATMAAVQTRIVESLGVPFADPFNEEGVIVDVNDPKKLGRVKVQTSDQIISEWIPVSGSNKGTLSARYIGAEVLIGKMKGRSEEMYVIGVVRGDPEVGISGNPLQLPVIDESMAIWNGSTDPGMSCNEGNEGRMYVLSNEMNQDVVVCLRRTSKQIGNKPAWAWKSITNGIWVEKGINPGNETTPAITQGQRNNPGIPPCTEALLGEVHEFTEDRGFRTTTMVCRRDENKNYSWLPIGAPPVYFRTILPSCTEKVHGMEAVLDDGNNSEFLVCQRYQGLMRWVRQGKRLPHTFFGKDKPLSRVQFTTSFNSIPALSEDPAPVRGYDWVSGISTSVFDTMIPNIPLTGTDPKLKLLLQTASLVPANAFDNADTVRRLATTILSQETGLPVDELVTILRTELDQNAGVLTPATAKLLVGIGEAGDVLVNGVVGGDVDSALIEIGTSTIRNALLSLEPKAASVMTGLMSGGIVGAVDSAVAIGLDQLPPEVNKYVAPVVDVAKDLLLSEYPASLSNILNSAVKGGLSSAISGSINTAIGSNIVSPVLVNSLVSGLTEGSFGPVSQIFNSLSNLDQIVKMPASLGSVPVLATTALGVLGQGDSLTKLLGGGGIGIDSLNGLLGGGFNSAKTLIDGIKGLRGVLGGVGGPVSGCPCDPKCRKTTHGEDSDNNNLLEKCGAATANNANSYSPVGAPIPNNTGPVAEGERLSNTFVGKPLVSPNPRDATSYIESVERAKNMAERFFDSRFADQIESVLELAYTFEATEKGLKVVDNNITGIESIERKLIDVLFNFLSDIVYNRKSGRGTMTDLIKDVRENSQAIKDVYNFVKALDLAKNGRRVGVRVTPNIAKSFQNIPDLASLSRVNREKALRMLRGGVIPADREWRSLTPGRNRDYKSELGTYTPALQFPYPSERTLFDENRILAEVVRSKVSDTSSNSPTLLESVLSSRQIDRLKSNGNRVSALSTPQDRLNRLGNLLGTDPASAVESLNRLGSGEPLTTALSSEQIRRLDRENIIDLTPEQSQLLAGNDITGLTPDQIRSLFGENVLGTDSEEGVFSGTRVFDQIRDSLGLPDSGESTLYDTVLNREGLSDCE